MSTKYNEISYISKNTQIKNEQLELFEFYE